MAHEEEQLESGHSPLDRMRHSTAHVMADAVVELFPAARVAIGPAIENGFYYDFDLPRPLVPEDLPQIEALMAARVAKDLPFRREAWSKADALRWFGERDQTYKVELIENLPDDEITIYQHGEFVDLCRGPHLERTGQIGPFKLLSIAGAYWRGDEHRPMLQRIYGTVFPTKEELEQHLHNLEEAERRDHRRLGRELDIFSVQDEVGAGLILWHPKGGILRETIETFWRAEHRRRGYDLVYTPHIGKVDLWNRSGHTSWFKDNMYPPMDVETQEYMLKPMNCPFHIMIFKSRLRSYRDMPMRLGELGTVYRYERSGVLHGALRVRGFTQDDAHIFCRPDQLEDEVIGVIDLVQFMLQSFGYSSYRIEMSLRDPENLAKYVGTDDVWQAAEQAIEGALAAKGLPYQRKEGEAKFYGPAIDIKLKDALGREWQGPTIQVDFNEPERFDITYVAEDGAEHRAVMVHRAVLGSMERFVGGLIEHYGGAFPVWLAPVQTLIIPIADRHLPYAEQVADQLRAAGLRAHVDARREKMNLKIREAQIQKVPYMLIVGDAEVEASAVAVRLRTGENLGPVPVVEFRDRAVERDRALSQEL